jgi:adenine-specific DNA-methyltransferase
LLKSLSGRTGLSQVFIVTDADESFKTMAQDLRDVAGKANPGLRSCSCTAITCSIS